MSAARYATHTQRSSDINLPSCGCRALHVAQISDIPEWARMTMIYGEK